MQINLLNGVDDVEFGISKQSLIDRYGAELNFEIIDEEEDIKTEAVVFKDSETTLYFEGSETEMIFSACDTENHDALLFGEKIFTKTEDEIKELMKARKYSIDEEDTEEWGEKRISYYDAMVDFFFEDGELSSISWGILVL
jgi:hypothetical protein